MAYKINAFGKRVVRGYIVRDDTGDTIPFQFNPTELEESLQATYVVIESPGATYPEIDYIGQKHRVIPITIQLDEVVKTTQNVRKTEYVMKVLDELRELTQPSKKLVRIRRGNSTFCETPTCRFVFGPRVIKCKVPQIKIKHTSFDRKLNTMSATVDIEILEVV